MSLYEHAEEPTMPRLEYDPAMDHPEPAPKRRKLPFEIANIGHGSKAYRMDKRTIITHRTAYTRYAFVMMLGSYAKEPHLTCDRRDVAKLLKHYRKGGAIMNQEQDNSAFPLHMHGDYGKGMTMRDYFAAAALQGFLAGRNINALDCSFYTCLRAAKSCYEYADAMLEARKEASC